MLTVTKLLSTMRGRGRPTRRGPTGNISPTRVLAVASVAAILILMAIGSSASVLADPPPTPVHVQFAANDRPYDGDTDATFNGGCTIVENTGTDDVHCDDTGATATFASKNAGPETLTGTGFSLVGTDAYKYEIVGATGNATIGQVNLTISAVTDSRPYNGTTSSTATPDVTGLQGLTDSVTGLTQSFDSKNAGPRTLSVDVGYTVEDDNGGANYIVDDTGTVAGSISQAPLDITAVTQARQYNGTTSSTGTPTLGSGQVQTGDGVTGLAQAFDSRNVGPRTLSVSAGYSVNDGNGGLNYNVATHPVAGSISQAPMIVNAITNEKTADGTASAAAIPTIGSTVFTGDNTTASFSETYADAAADYPKALTPAGHVNDGNGGLNYSYTYNTFANGRIRPGPVETLQFTAQPIDTKTGQPIYNSCAPGGTPCATSSLPVQVTARDHYGNFAGPGSPGADGTTATINVVIKKDSSGGAILGPTGGTPTSNGVASFGGNLVVAGTFIGHTTLYAFTTSPATNKTSDDFRIVNDLAPCRAAVCKNSIGNGGNNKTLQYLYGQINSNGTYAATTLTTQFVGVNQVDARCGSNHTINSGVELRASGSDVNTTSTGYMLLIIPKDTLKADGVVSRGTPSFNVCLGTLYLGDGTPGSYGSQHAKWNTLSGLASERQDTTALDGDTYYRYWGAPANCGARGLTPTDPCISLRTKQKADITALINQGLLSAGADTNMHDSDLAIVIKKPSPWDGKGGVY